MSHADTLRGMANGPHPGLSYSAVVALIAGAQALDARERVRAVLTDLRGQQEAGLQRWDLHDTIHILTEVLGGDLE